MKYLVFVCLFFSSLSFAVKLEPASDAHATEVDELVKTCGSVENLPLNAPNFWRGTKTSPVVGSADLTTAPMIKVGAREDLQLVDTAKLKMFTPTRKTGKDAGTKGHGGFYKFTTLDKKSDYTIVAPKGVWLEIIDLEDKKLVESSDHEMLPDCELYHKVVRFPLKAIHSYGLQVTGVEDTKTSVMIFAAPAAK